MKKYSALLLILALTACSAWSSVSPAGPLTAAGTIEADLVRLGPELGGRIIAITAQRGDNVAAGAEVFRLDDAALQTQLAQAQAAVQAAQAAQAAARANQAAAQANLALLQAGPTAAQLQGAQAQLAQADANRQALQSTIWAVTAGVRPETVAAAQTRLDLARLEYFSLTVVLSTTQVENVHEAAIQADTNLTQAVESQTSLTADTRTTAAIVALAAQRRVDAQAAVQAATQALTAVQDPQQPYYLQLQAVRTAWNVADLNLAQARARLTSLNTETDVTQAAQDAAQAAVDDAQAWLEACAKAYDGLATGDRANRLQSAWVNVQTAQAALNGLSKAAAGTASLESLLSQLAAATAQQEVAQANLTNLQSGAREQQLAASQALVDAAQAQVDATGAQVAATQAAMAQIQVQLGKYSVKAPVAGVVLDRPLNVGEMATPGATVVELGALDKVTLTVFIPEDQYGQLHLGQSASISVDSFPGRTFQGTVDYISDQAEFTPRNVQTVETRSTTVYAVKIGLANPDHALKPGMPADATFQP